MNKQELIKILKEQRTSFNEDVYNKLAYLKSDEVFSNDYNGEFDAAGSVEEIDLASAFGLAQKKNNAENITYTTYERTTSANNEKQFAVPTQVPLAEKTKSESSSSQPSKLSIAAKIAALRGISFPGDTIQRK